MKKIITRFFVLALFFALAGYSYAESYTLTVASSNPSSGVAIAASPNDRNGRGSGTTQFTRYYSDSTSITLTAPSTANGNTFQKWQRDGYDYSTNRTITFSLSRNRTMKAVYVTGSSTASYTLTVDAKDDLSMPITVSPADKNGQTNGTTTFTRTYAAGTVVTLTAPASAPNGYVFSEWEKNGNNYSTSQSVTVTITANTIMEVDYDPTTSNDTTAPITTASPAGGSYSGSVNVTLTPNETATTYYCTGSSSCTPTTVYSAPIAISASTTLRYYSRDAANNSESVKTATYTITTATTAYTLTVASSSPSSGVAVSVSPADRNGATNGTTQFTRSYNSGTSVTLTAPATASGNNFSKWQKNGVDAGTAPSVTVAMTANTTMTAVFVTPPPSGGTEQCQNGIDDDNDGQIDCADTNCSTDASCTGALNSSHRSINKYDGPSTCTGCHSTAGTEVLNSMHGSWLGATPNVTNIAGDAGKWGQTNNYCTDPQLADFGCLKCHVSLVAPVDFQGKVDMSKANLTAADMDCLQCHQAKYFATFTPVDSTATNYDSCVDGTSHTYKTPVADPDGKIRKAMRLDLAPGETALSLARTVTLPNNATCVTKCHAKAGGSDGAKRGDIASHLVNATTAQDVHLSPAGTAKLTCISCHAGSSHQIPGRGNDMRGEDTGAVKKCVDCHAAMGTSTGHGTSTANRQAANRHIAKVDCTGCHIDSFGKGVSTEMSRDWTAPIWNPAGCEGQGAYIGHEVRGSNVVPEYRFWNKTSWVYDRNGTTGLTTDLIDGGLAMSYPLGDMTTGKLYPFKVHTSKNPIDSSSGKTNFDVMKMFMTGCFDEAAVSGLSFIGESGAYTWTDNKAFQLITHGVASKTEGNNCTKCHVTNVNTSVVSKLDKLGYKTPKPTSDLCNDCHGLETSSGFTSIHDRHVRSEGYNCSRCHSFTR